MQSAFFLHVPKTGGSTVDNILGEEFPAQLTARGVQHSATLEQWGRIDDTSIRYLSGHIPAGALDLSRFEQRITVLRPPEDCLASFISYADRHFPGHNARENIAREGSRWSLYASFFSPGFDNLRYMTERRYGVERDHFVEYADECTVPEAISVLEQFGSVLDFQNLNAEICRLVIEQGCFPRDAISNLRSDKHVRGDSSVQDLLSPFDLSFYEAARKHFRPVPDNIEIVYDHYRRDYCKTRGLSIGPRNSLGLDLTGPIGTGWNAAEVSEKGQHFRWSNTSRPTLNIPIARSGDYCLTLYLKPYQVTNLRATVSSLISGEQVVMQSFLSPRVEHQGMVVLRATITLPGSDWLDVRLDCDPPPNTATTQELQANIFLLGNALVRRGA